MIELKQALVNGDWQPFDDQTILMLMRIFDVDGNGTITFGEFEGLWNYVKEWQGYISLYDSLVCEERADGGGRERNTGSSDSLIGIEVERLNLRNCQTLFRRSGTTSALS